MLVLPITGGFFLLATLVFFLGFNKGQKDRRSILFLILALVLGGLLGLLVYWFDKKGIMELSAGYLLAQIIFLVLGILFPWLLYNKLFWTKRDGFIRAQDSFLPEFVYTLLTGLALSLGMILVLFYLMKVGINMYWGVGVVFLVPFLFLKTLDFLRQIPLKDFKVKWAFSQRLINENEWNWSNEMWISFEVRESWNKPGINRNAKFRILAPRNAPLGEIFRLAIREYNKQGKKIVVQDLGFESENTGLFWWLFSLKTVWNRPHTWFPNLRYLDPGDSALANALRPGDLVKVRRISTGKVRQSDEFIAVGQVIQ